MSRSYKGTRHIKFPKEEVFKVTLLEKIKSGQITFKELNKLKKIDLEHLTENFPFVSKKMKKSDLIVFLIGEKKRREDKMNRLAKYLNG